MMYSLEKKKEIINSKPKDVNVRAYCENICVSYSSYYKWIKEITSYYNANEKVFVDVTDIINEANDTTIDLEVSNITIHVSNCYDENHLLKIINTLRKL